MWNCRLLFLLLTANMQCNCQCYCMPADHNLYYIHVEMDFFKGRQISEVSFLCGMPWVSFDFPCPSPFLLFCLVLPLLSFVSANGPFCWFFQKFIQYNYSTTVLPSVSAGYPVFFVTRLYLIAFVQQLGVGRWYTHLASIYHRHSGICHCALM